MKQSYIVPIAAIGVLAVVWMPTIGQQEEGETAAEAIAGELAGIREALDELAIHVSDVRRGKNADSVLRRIELYEQRVSPHESGVRRYTREAADREIWIADVEERLKVTRERIRDIEREGLEPVPQELRDLLDNLLQVREQHKKELELVHKRRMEHEDRASDLRDEIEILEERLETLLD